MCGVWYFPQRLKVSFLEFFLGSTGISTKYIKKIFTKYWILKSLTQRYSLKKLRFFGDFDSMWVVTKKLDLKNEKLETNMCWKRQQYKDLSFYQKDQNSKNPFTTVTKKVIIKFSCFNENTSKLKI